MAMELSINDPWYKEKMSALTALYNVIDPELFVNIVDLGLVYGIGFDNPEKIKLTMTLTTKNCPLGESMEQGVKNVLGMAFPERETEIEIVWEPEWSFDAMTPEGRKELGID